MSETRKQLENWLAAIKIKEDSLLDIGGLVLPVMKRLQKCEVKNYKILDIREEYKERKPDYCLDINYYHPIEENFDAVFCLETFEYVFNPVMALNNIFNYLKPNGLLYLSTHFIFPYHEGGVDSLRYTKKGISKLLQVSNFNIISIKDRIENGKETGHLTIAQKC